MKLLRKLWGKIRGFFGAKPKPLNTPQQPRKVEIIPIFRGRKALYPELTPENLAAAAAKLETIYLEKGQQFPIGDQKWKICTISTNDYCNMIRVYAKYNGKFVAQ